MIKLLICMFNVCYVFLIYIMCKCTTMMVEDLRLYLIFHTCIDVIRIQRLINLKLIIFGRYSQSLNHIAL